MGEDREILGGPSCDARVSTNDRCQPAERVFGSAIRSKRDQL